MAIDHPDPVRDLMHLRERIEHLFRDALGRSAGPLEAGSVASWRPPVDVWAQGDRYHLRVDLPGVASEDVAIEVEGGVLHVRGERRGDGGVPRDRFLRAERPLGRFAVSVTLPPSVDAQGIEAKQHDGVLEITLRRVTGERAGRFRVPLR